MGSAIPHPVSRVRPLPLSGLLRLGRPSEIWFKPALSVVVAAAPPNLTLVALGRLDLAAYTMAGSLCAPALRPLRRTTARTRPGRAPSSGSSSACSPVSPSPWSPRHSPPTRSCW